MPCSGQLNIVADGLKWTVPEDLEVNVGLTHDIFHAVKADMSEIAQLREWFKGKPIFAEVIDAILELDQGVSL